MKDKEKQITKMPICVNCIHAYVCEEYNLNRDMLRKRCAYHNDHFLDIEQYKKQERKETAEKILFKFESAFAYYDNEDMFSKKAIFECLEEIVKSCGIEIKE